MKTTPFWFASPEKILPRLEGDVTADAVVIGGGISGLTVAQLLSERGASVVLLERYTCGSGATGRSSGFMTPDSELQVDQLVRRFGAEDAGRLWRAASAACEHVRETIARYELQCDYIEADSLYIAADRASRSTIESEHQSRLEAGLPSTLYSNSQGVLKAEGYDAAVRYEDTFAMTPYRYVRELRDRLPSVRVFENSAVTDVRGDVVTTSHGRARSGAIYFCADRDLAKIGSVRSAAYHAQTYLAATKPLPSSAFRKLFPDGDLLVWDTDLIYHYFRRTADDRLLVGGGRLRNTYGPQTEPIVDDLRKYAADRLPAIGDIEFSHAWSGLIGVTKDFLPVAGRHRDHLYAGCGAGVPWSVLAAQCAVERPELEKFFDPHRAFTDLDPLQPVLRKPATFALSHAYTKGVLRGTASDVRRRRPFIFGALLALAWRVVRSAAGRRS